MKYCLALTLLATAAWADPVGNFAWERDLPTARSMAKATGKPVAIAFLVDAKGGAC
jgi:hypothetical protein